MKIILKFIFSFLYYRCQAINIKISNNMKKVFNKIVKAWNKFWNTPITGGWLYTIYDIISYGVNPTTYTINKLKH